MHSPANKPLFTNKANAKDTQGAVFTRGLALRVSICEEDALRLCSVAYARARVHKE